MANPSDTPIIVWFRRDLRLADNPALAWAVATGRPIVPVYVFDANHEGRARGAASLWWLDKSLRSLDQSLRERGSRLVLRRGNSEAELRRLIDQTGSSTLVLNRMVEPLGRAHDADLIKSLADSGISVEAFDAATLQPPGAVLSGSGGPYKVFSPFARALLALTPSDTLSPPPLRLPNVADLASDDLADWGLHPTRPDWSGGFDWKPSETAALARLSAFLGGAGHRYAKGRDIPGDLGTSRLSPHLHWGELSPSRAVHDARGAVAAGLAQAEADKFISEIAWRDFSAHLLAHFPYMAHRNFRTQFDAMPWQNDPVGLSAWQRGQTGYPIVDAGMRQVWAAGWMHNRVRMVVASFLVKHLMIDWREGEAWFWDTLVDADLGNNVQNWQWVAGSGADAAPYFRIYNPVTQGEKFDGDGRYVRKWVPELARLPDRWLHAPWTAPAEVLVQAGIRLGQNYPKPIVDHAEARARALAALKLVSGPDQRADPEH